jgi:hypothetical protein
MKSQQRLAVEEVVTAGKAKNQFPLKGKNWQSLRKLNLEGHHINFLGLSEHGTEWEKGGIGPVAIFGKPLEGQRRKTFIDARKAERAVACVLLEGSTVTLLHFSGGTCFVENSSVTPVTYRELITDPVPV